MTTELTNKGKIGNTDINFATGGTSAAEEYDRETSTGGTLTLEKVDASHLKFRTVAKSVDDLVDGGGDVDINVNDATITGNAAITGTVAITGAVTASSTVTLTAMSSAGFVKNSVAGLLSGGNSIAAGDLPAASTSAKGGVELATDAEAQAMSNTTLAITPSNLAAIDASQSDMETATSVVRYVTPGVAKYHPGVAKAWAQVTYAGGTPTANASYNCTITDLGEGYIRFTFTVPFSSVNYAAAAMAAMDSGTYVAVAHLNEDSLPTASTCDVYLLHTGDASPVDPKIMSIAFFGDQ